MAKELHLFLSIPIYLNILPTHLTSFPSTKDMAHLIVFWNSTFRRGKLVFTQNNKSISTSFYTHSALIQTKEINHSHSIIEENEIVWNNTFFPKIQETYHLLDKDCNGILLFLKMYTRFSSF